MGGIGTSIAIIAIGAVLTFALEREAEGINLYSRERRGTALRERQAR